MIWSLWPQLWPRLLAAVVRAWACAWARAGARRLPARARGAVSAPRCRRCRRWPLVAGAVYEEAAGVRGGCWGVRGGCWWGTRGGGGAAVDEVGQAEEDIMSMMDEEHRTRTPRRRAQAEEDSGRRPLGTRRRLAAAAAAAGGRRESTRLSPCSPRRPCGKRGAKRGPRGNVIPRGDFRRGRGWAPFASRRATPTRARVARRGGGAGGEEGRGGARRAAGGGGGRRARGAHSRPAREGRGNLNAKGAWLISFFGEQRARHGGYRGEPPSLAPCKSPEFHRAPNRF